MRYIFKCLQAASWLACALVLSVAAISPQEAHATEYTVQRRDYRFETYFEVASEGASIATVRRQRWRQPLQAHYALVSSSGVLLGQATTQIFSLGIIFPWAKTLNIADADGTVLWRVTGDWFTAEKARFRLIDAHGETVAKLHLDQHRTSCLAASPTDPLEVWVRFSRNSVSNIAADRWDFTTMAAGPVPDFAWQLIAAFLADTWA